MKIAVMRWLAASASVRLAELDRDLSLRATVLKTLAEAPESECLAAYEP
ncbi:MAG: hypothetical protein K2X79_12155 [Burkholderiaceae bacterium]|nr:hypothetical protein [Burkholderiaceae bacterium]